MENAFPFIVPFIRWADIADFAIGQSMPNRMIYDHELVYVLSGNGRVIVNGRTFPVTRDQLFFVHPRIWHSFHCEDKPFALLGVHFDWTPRADTMRFSVHREATLEEEDVSLFREPKDIEGWDVVERPSLDLKNRPAIRRRLEDLLAVYGGTDGIAGDEEGRLAAGALLAATLMEISREACSLRQQALALPYGPDAVRRTERAQALLETTQPLMSVDEVAARIGWSADHLRRMFRVLRNTTPQKCQMSARMRLARELLRAGNLPIGEVASRCGFEDASHFARVFKAENGLSPRQFLAMSKK